MAYELKTEIVADASGYVAGTEQAAAATAELGASADAAATRGRGLGTALGDTTTAATAATSRSELLAAALAGAASAMQTASGTMDQATAASHRQTAATTALRDTMLSLAQAERERAEEARRAAAVSEQAARAAERHRANHAALLAERAAAKQAAEEEARAAAAKIRWMGELQARYVPLAAEAQLYRAALAEIRQAESAGALTGAQAAAAIARTKEAFAEQVKIARAAEQGLSRWAATGKMAGWEATQLSAQFYDIAVSLQSGMNPVTVLVQQGAQIAPLFGGMRGMLSALASVMTAGRIAAGGLTAAVVAGAMAWNDYDGAMRTAHSAATGLGRGLGVTAGDIDALAQSSSDAAGLSVSAARSMATGFVATGKIGKDLYGGLISIARDFGATIGTTSEEAGAKLAEIFADPAKGAAELHTQYGLIDGATARYVARLAEQGRAEEARRALLIALPANLTRATDATNTFASAWDGVARAASNAWDWIGRTIDKAAGGGTAAEQIARLRREIAQLEYVANAPLNPGAGDAANRLIGKREELARLTKADADRQAEEVRAKAMRAADDKASRGAAVAAALPDLDGQRGLATLRDQQRALREGLANGALGSERQAQATALNAVTRAIETYMPPAEKAARLQQIDLQMMQARDPVTKASLAAERARVELAGQAVTAADAQAAAERARNQVLGETLAMQTTAIADMRLEIQQRRAVNDAVSAGTATAAEAERQMRIETELRPLIVAHARAEGAAKEQLALIIQSLRDAYADLAVEERRAAALDIQRGQNERIARLKIETGLIGQSADVRARTLATLSAEAEMRQRGIALGSAEAAQIRANAAAEADYGTVLERQRDAYQTLSDFGSSALDQITQSIAENGLSWETLGDTVNAVVADMIQTFAKLAVLNPLKNAVFGTNEGTLADTGGIIGRLTGNKTAANDNGTAANDNATVTTAATAAATAATRTLAGATSGARPIDVARSYMGATESGNTAQLQALFAEGAGIDLNPEQQAWCAAYASAAIGVANGGAGPSFTRAADFASYGTATDNPQVGDLVVMKNHVGFYEGQTSDGRVRVTGGNQSDSVSTMSVDPSAVIAYRQIPQSGATAAQAIDRLAGSASDAATATDGMTTRLQDSGQSVDRSAARVSDAGQNLAASTEQTAAQTQTAGNTLVDGLTQVGSSLVSGLGGILDQILSVATGGASGGFSVSSLLSIGFSAVSSVGKGLSSLGSSAFPAAAGAAQYDAASRLGGYYSGGGYTGPGGKYEPAGTVHRGEVVWSQDDVARAGGVSVVESMRRGLRGYADGGAVGLESAYDLAAARGASPAQRQSAPAEGRLSVTFGDTHVTMPEGATMSREEVARAIAEAQLQVLKQVPTVVREAQKSTRGRAFA